MSKNIYVGNLDYNVTEDELRGAFAAYGQVDNVTIGTNFMWDWAADVLKPGM